MKRRSRAGRAVVIAVALCGCQPRGGALAPGGAPSALPSGDSVEARPAPITEAQAVRIAFKAVDDSARRRGQRFRPRSAAMVHRDGNRYVVTYPTLLPRRVRGASFQARVYVDADTGRVIGIEYSV